MDQLGMIWKGTSWLRASPECGMSLPNHTKLPLTSTFPSLPADRIAPRGGLEAANVVSASVDRLNPGCYVRDREKRPATGRFSPLGNGHFRDRDLPGSRRNDVACQDVAPQLRRATSCRDFLAKGIAWDGLSPLAG